MRLDSDFQATLRAKNEEINSLKARLEGSQPSQYSVLSQAIAGFENCSRPPNMCLKHALRQWREAIRGTVLGHRRVKTVWEVQGQLASLSISFLPIPMAAAKNPLRHFLVLTTHKPASNN